jgi:hypothetical protein
VADKKNWMAGAVKRPGAFRAKAEKAGMSTSAYAAKEAHNPNADPRTRKQAVLSQTFAKSRKNKRGGKRSKRR